MALFSAALLVAVVTFRMLHEGQNHLSEAERLLAAGDRAQAAERFEDAAKSYVPGSPYPPRALAKLEVMARSAEMRGDAEQATAFWAKARRAILATRHLWQPHETELVTCEQALRRLTVKEQNDKSNVKPDTAARPIDPSPIASLLLFGGLLAWILGALTLCLLPRDPERRSAARRRAWMVCIAGLGLWLAMAWLAG